MTRLRLVLGSVVLAVCLGGCGGPENSQLVGTWLPFEVAQDDGNIEPPGDPKVQLTFEDDGTWKASTGCDSSRGTYDLRVDGSFSGEEAGGSASTPCPRIRVSAILKQADHVSFTQCSATLEKGGHELVAMSRKGCGGTSELGGGLPPGSGE